MDFKKIFLLTLILAFAVCQNCPNATSPNITFGDIEANLSASTTINATGYNPIQLSWGFLNNNTTFQMRVQVNNCGFLGVLYGLNMLGNDAFISQINNTNGTVVATFEDHWASGTKPPAFDTALGGQSNYVGIGYFISSNVTVFKFQRDLVTNDQFDYQFVYGQPLDLSIVFTNSSSIQYHGNNVFQTSIFFNSGNTPPPQPTPTYNCPNATGANITYGDIAANLSASAVVNAGSYGPIQLSWGFVNNNTAYQMRVQVNNCGFLGVLYGSNAMFGSDLFISQINVTDGNIVATFEDYYASGYFVPSPDTNFIGGQSNYQGLGYFISNNRTVFQFQRNLQTNDYYDYQFTYGQSLPLSIVFTNSSNVVFHGSNVYQANVYFNSNNTGPSPAPVPSSGSISTINKFYLTLMVVILSMFVAF